jgi:hypothetical protein
VKILADNFEKEKERLNAPEFAIRKLYSPPAKYLLQIRSFGRILKSAKMMQKEI